MKPIRLGQISYLNVAPIYYGLMDNPLPQWIQLKQGTPAELNRWMAAGSLDAGPVSTGVLAENTNRWKVLPDLSIGCSGKVLSVLLLSRRPMVELHRKNVFLSGESGTANLLLQLLLTKEEVEPRYKIAPSLESNHQLKEADAFLIIGDKALTQQAPSGFEYVWDLGEIWWQKTGLPFTFAVWVVRNDVLKNDPSTIRQLWQKLLASKKSGLAALDTIANQAAPQLGIDQASARNYYRHLHYDLEPSKLKGIETFFQELYRCKLIPALPKVSFFNPDLYS